jgi:hypothetical protein
LIGAAGALLLAVHLALHLPGAEARFATPFTIADQGGTWLLIAAALVDWRAMRRWLSDQRSRLAAVAPALVAEGAI